MEKHKDEACDYYEIHEDSMEIINKTMPEETELEDLADLFKIFGDSPVPSQSAISHQLRILKQNKLVKNRREGKSIFYSLADDHVRTIINQGREHIEEN